VTGLYKEDVYPIIRFNTHDVSAYRTDASPLGLTFRRIEGFLGRSDNMVKLRGINVFPQAIGAVLREEPACAGEYVCKVTRDAMGRDEMTVLVESLSLDGATQARCEAVLRRALGVDVGVQLVPIGATAAATQLETRQKPIRLIDERTS
jgi:phenylacetate-CoA ligase